MFALAGILVVVFPSQEMLLALMGLWFAPVAALACLGALVGTIVAWQEWRVVVATLLVAITMPLAAAVLGNSPAAVGYEKALVFWIVGVFTLDTYFALRWFRAEWTQAALAYGAVLLVVGYVLTTRLNRGD